MEDIALIFQILEGGSNAALIAIAVAVWKVERRVFNLELWRKYSEKQNERS